MSRGPAPISCAQDCADSTKLQQFGTSHARAGDAGDGHRGARAGLGTTLRSSAKPGACQSESPAVRVFLVDDDTSLLDSLRVRYRRANAEWSLETYADPRQALASLEHCEVAVIVTGRWVNRVDTLDFCRSIRELQARSAEPRAYYIVMLADASDLVHPPSGRGERADDYLRKPFDFAELRHRVNVGFRVATAELALKQSNRRHSEVSESDPLTGLLTRQGMTQRAGVEIGRVRRGLQGISVALIEVDNFDRVNENYGYHVGSAVLSELSSFLRKSVRDYDLLARWDGEKFLVVFPATGRAECISVLERLRGGISMIHGVGAASLREILTVSVGCVSVPAGSFEPFEALLQRADDGLREAKSQGCDSTVCDC